MAYSFGQDFIFWFYPLVDDKPAVVPAAIQGQTPSIFVFPDSLPSRQDAVSGAGAIQSIASWTWNPTKNGWSFTIDGIDDPDPVGGIFERTYWIAINFRLSSSEQPQCVLRSVELERPAGHQFNVEVDETDLQSFYPQIGVYATLAHQREHILNGITQVRSALKAKGFRWTRLTRPDHLKPAVCYRALAMLFLSQAQGNDKFAALYQEFKTLYQTEIDSLTIDYDSDNDGDRDASPVFGSAGILVVR